MKSLVFTLVTVLSLVASADVNINVEHLQGFAGAPKKASDKVSMAFLIPRDGKLTIVTCTKEDECVTVAVKPVRINTPVTDESTVYKLTDLIDLEVTSSFSIERVKHFYLKISNNNAIDVSEGEQFQRIEMRPYINFEVK